MVTNGFVKIGESGVYGDVVITVLYVLRLQDAVYHDIIKGMTIGVKSVINQFCYHEMPNFSLQRRREGTPSLALYHAGLLQMHVLIL